jgi:hypothetical protein
MNYVTGYCNNFYDGIRDDGGEILRIIHGVAGGLLMGLGEN